MGRGRQQCADWMLNFDFFGYPVSLFYHKSHQKKKSLFGLVVSIFMFMGLVTYAAFLGHRVGNPEHQHVVHSVYNIDLNKEEPMRLSKQELRFFAYFYKA